MNRPILASTLIVLWGLSGPAMGADDRTEAAIVLTLDLTDGSRIVGTPASNTLPLTTPYASLDLPLAQVASLSFQEDHETVQVELRNGDRLTGALDRRRFALKTLLGPLEVRTVHVRHISVRLGLSPDTQRGLVLHYSFDEGFEKSGQVKDKIGHGPALRVSKGSVTHAEGIRGGAAHLQGGVLSCDSNPTAGMKDATLSIWFKTPHPERDYKLATASWWRGGLNASGWNIGTHYAEMWADNNKPLFVEGATTTKPKRTLAANQWNHIVVTFNREELREYINGELYRTSKCTGAPFGRGANLTLGNWMNAFPYHGLLDEFMVFNRALSAEEVSRLHSTIH